MKTDKIQNVKNSFPSFQRKLEEGDLAVFQKSTRINGEKILLKFHEYFNQTKYNPTRYYIVSLETYHKRKNKNSQYKNGKNPSAIKILRWALRVLLKFEEELKKSQSDESYTRKSSKSYIVIIGTNAKRKRIYKKLEKHSYIPTYLLGKKTIAKQTSEV